MTTRVVRSSDLQACPKRSLLPQHYRDDGTCRCNEREAAKLAVEKAQKEAIEGRERVDQQLREARAWLRAT